MKTFYFNTGVLPHAHTPPVKAGKGQVLRGGTVQIPFDCEDVPENAIFKHACDNPEAGPGHIVREIHNSAMVSKYAHFLVPTPTPAPAPEPVHPYVVKSLRGDHPGQQWR